MFKPPNPNFFDSDPSVALANAQQARGINSLNAWLKAQQQLAGLNSRVETQRINRQQGLDRENILNRLAGNGLGSSGDVGYLQGQSALDFNDKRYDSNANTLQSLADLMGSYLTKKEGIRDNTLNAYQGAYESAGQNPVPGFQAPVGPAAPHRKRKPAVPSPYKYGGGTAPVYKPIPSPRGTY